MTEGIFSATRRVPDGEYTIPQYELPSVRGRLVSSIAGAGSRIAIVQSDGEHSTVAVYPVPATAR